MMLYELDDIEKRALMESVVDRARADLNDGRPLMEMRLSEKDRSIAEIRTGYDSWRAFHCTPENAAVFERENEQTHRDIGTLLRALDQ